MANEPVTVKNEDENRNFIYNFIKEDIAPGGQYEGMTVHTRFPPEPSCSVQPRKTGGRSFISMWTKSV